MFVTQYNRREIAMCAITFLARFARQSFCRSIAMSLVVGLVSLADFARADCFSSPAGLIGWWPGDGNANNVLGTNNGVLQGGATANTAGVVATAFNFDGTNNYVQIA